MAFFVPKPPETCENRRKRRRKVLFCVKPGLTDAERRAIIKEWKNSRRFYENRRSNGAAALSAPFRYERAASEEIQF
jgi:hypothetical protein